MTDETTPHSSEPDPMDFFTLDTPGKVSYIGWGFLIFGMIMMGLLIWLDLSWTTLALTFAGPFTVWAGCMIVAAVLRRTK